MLEMRAQPFVKGFTTNPTLMRKAGVANYEAFAKDILAAIPDRPISFEVFADDFAEMECHARRIAQWGKHVSVKIPITNTRKESAIPLVRKLSKDGIALNVTATFTLDQMQAVVDAVRGGGTLLRIRVCRPHCRHRGRSRADHGDGRRAAQISAQLGESARTAKHFPDR
jgi:transaldolase